MGQERMAKEGKHGDLLGFNQNFGQKIVLRLRTDDCKGFRPYYDLINTLLHEITHNVFGPHDEKFWALFRELKKEYDTFHDAYSRSGKSIGGTGAPVNLDSSDDDAVAPQVLGGGGAVGGSSGIKCLDAAELRQLAAQRAEDRFLQQQQTSSPKSAFVWQSPASSSTTPAPISAGTKKTVDSC